jgi:mannose-1-phosphate guanylyltransferase
MIRGYEMRSPTSPKDLTILHANAPMAFPKASRNLWAVLLAGGDGTRLRELTLKIAGDSRPKQFCRLVGRKSLLDQTRARLEPVISQDRQLLVVSRAHERYYGEDLTDTDDSCVIVQPLNRGTGIAIAVALLRLLVGDPSAVVGLFPCDHYYSDDGAFRSTVRRAMAYASRYPEFIILVGAKAEYPEIEYGWIEPGATVLNTPAGPLCRVNRFWEKPALHQARTFFRNRCLWNTFITVGRAATFLELLCSTVPEAILSITQALADSGLDTAYRLLPTVDFSRDVLAHQPHRLLVLRDAASGWTDLGSPARVFETLTRNRLQPEWFRAVSRSSREFAHRSRNEP